MTTKAEHLSQVKDMLRDKKPKPSRKGLRWRFFKCFWTWPFGHRYWNHSYLCWHCSHPLGSFLGGMTDEDARWVLERIEGN